MSMDESEREALEFLNNASVREKWRLSDEERAEVLARSKSERPRETLLAYHHLSKEAFERMGQILRHQQVALKVWDCVILFGIAMAVAGIWLFAIYGLGEWARTMLFAGLGMTVSGCGVRFFLGRKRLDSEFFKAGLGALNLNDEMVDELFAMENSPNGISLRQGQDWLNRAISYEQRVVDGVDLQMRSSQPRKNAR